HGGGPARGGAPRDRRVLPLRPAGPDEAAARDPRGLSKSWYPVVRDFELAPGGYQAKIVVRDKNSGRIGTVVHEFEVPDISQFRVSTPIISDALQKSPEGEKAVPRPVLSINRAFASGSTVFA